ncbi:hypothetical protein N7468_008039 [Penicillium chermesinum]|uniref:Uncharacterized protein n=1 Tax=Penicillium chermesinum TaxID=63820 RepID=A0A9W9NP19_9EURO|nr:uncharacterized protein N7468_008039 [Penicillium chermesinum]KAJ5223497.1 hypothetical protein N7468_008039 [Penicillium chermesinum]KAJ6155671.1 hypothetical protein N7470_006237 [Penicillium chermesinum]
MQIFVLPEKLTFLIDVYTLKDKAFSYLTKSSTNVRSWEKWCDIVEVTTTRTSKSQNQTMRKTTAKNPTMKRTTKGTPPVLLPPPTPIMASVPLQRPPRRDAVIGGAVMAA